MTSLNYAEIYSRFFTKVEAYDLFDPNMENSSMARELMCSWLHSAINYPYIRRLFSSCTMDDDGGALEFEMTYVIDEAYDTEFVTEVLANGMVLGWVSPKVDSITAITQAFTESDTKFYSQAQHLSELRAVREEAETRIRRLIRDRGYLNNQYLDGAAASARIRG